MIIDKNGNYISPEEARAAGMPVAEGFSFERRAKIFEAIKERVRLINECVAQEQQRLNELDEQGEK
ncbi:hypothetical protein EOL96_02300 [Candidatus Saccharibacteria bacterium]|nr:hypothetical protein [Candidatus Saccharibacteria bacterium]